MFNTTKRTNLSIVQWNCRSLNNKLTELHLLIDEEKPDIIALNETWLKNGASLRLPGYKCTRKDRDGYGGVLLAFKEDLLITEIKLTTNYECVCCSIQLQQQQILNIF